MRRKKEIAAANAREITCPDPRLYDAWRRHVDEVRELVRENVDVLCQSNVQVEFDAYQNHWHITVEQSTNDKRRAVTCKAWDTAHAAATVETLIGIARQLVEDVRDIAYTAATR